MRYVFLLGAALATPLSAFFTFYTVRLYIVTRLFTVAPPNAGAYIGAVVFPAAAIAFGLCARWCWRKGMTR